MAGDPARNNASRSSRPKFSTLSGMEVDEVYGPDDVRGDIGEPGQYPFTRGVYPTMYRAKPWTTRLFMLPPYCGCGCKITASGASGAST